MQIHGFSKTTLLDYPGIVAATIFTGSCNFRCPFCQNADLVLNPASQPLISEEEVLAHLTKREGILKGVCITGGEPTLQADLEDFVRKIKSMGLMVKLDTNGYRPEVLKKLVMEGLVDYVAMDIKSSPSNYSLAAGIKVDVEKIRESVAFLKEGHVDYEFRTTVSHEMHSDEVMEELADFIEGAPRYFLQGYKDSERVICPGLTAYDRDGMEKLKKIFESRVGCVEIRGVD